METSSVGRTFIDTDGVEYEVVWAGGEGLVPDRPTKANPDTIWEPPPRLYNKTGKHAKDKQFWKRKKMVLRPEGSDTDVEHCSGGNESDRGSKQDEQTD